MGDSLLGTCYSAPQLHALQWINPQVVKQAQLPLGRVVQFTISASTRSGSPMGTPGRVALVVSSWTNRTWLSLAAMRMHNTLGTGTDWYFNLLMRDSPNERLPEQFHNRIAMHTWTRTPWPSFTVVAEFRGSLNTGETFVIKVRVCMLRCDH